MFPITVFDLKSIFLYYLIFFWYFWYSQASIVLVTIWWKFFFPFTSPILCLWIESKSLTNRIWLDYLFLIHSVNLCLFIRELNPFAFKVITDKENLTSAIFLFVFCMSYRLFLYFFCFYLLLYLIDFFILYHFNSLFIIFVYMFLEEVISDEATFSLLPFYNVCILIHYTVDLISSKLL